MPRIGKQKLYQPTKPGEQRALKQGMAVHVIDTAAILLAEELRCGVQEARELLLMAAAVLDDAGLGRG